MWSNNIFIYSKYILKYVIYYIILLYSIVCVFLDITSTKYYFNARVICDPNVCSLYSNITIFCLHFLLQLPNKNSISFC